VNLPGWRPIDDVPVTETEGFEPAPESPTAMEAHPDRGLTVKGVWRTSQGLLVRVEERNDSADDISSFDTVTLSDLRVADIDGLRVSVPRQADFDPIVDPKPDDGIPAGRRITRDALVADLPGADEVVVTMRGARRTLPISVGDEAPNTLLEVGPDAETPETASLDPRAILERTTPLAVAEPDLPGLTDEGPRLDYGPPVDELTSEAQPGWTVAPRSVIRVGDRQSILTFDLARNGTDRSWPEGLGQRSTGNDLDAIALIDVENEERISALVGNSRATGNRRDDGVSDGFSRSLYVGYPALAGDAESVTVDVPGFGQVPDVPVVDLADAVEEPGADTGVAATTAATYNPGLRIDILDVGSLPDDEGTLVRFRAVNDSNPDAVDSPFVDSDNGCNLALVDPDTNRRFFALEPCQTTDWSAPLGVGDSLEYEVRFPVLPADVSSVLLEGATLGAAPPVAVENEVSPWYLDLPRPADPPSGDTHRGFIGVADDLQTEVASGDEVDLQLDTDVLFEFGSAELTPEARDRVVEVAERLTDQSSGAMTVTGHTDSVGSPDENLVLSEQRAQAVADVLTDVAGDRFDLSVDGQGDTDPVADNEIDGRDNPDGRARNRRVTITYTAT
jgi:outer membrane protein OmpA-like peptidoglycan-associated protein